MVDQGMTARIIIACYSSLAIWLSVADLVHAAGVKKEPGTVFHNKADATIGSDKTNHQVDKLDAPITAEPQGECPDGYRLHYQGFCINIADELRDDPVKGVRGVQSELYPK